jgi:hypothetical protein
MIEQILGTIIFRHCINPNSFKVRFQLDNFQVIPKLALPIDVLSFDSDCTQKFFLQRMFDWLGGQIGFILTPLATWNNHQTRNKGGKQSFNRKHHDGISIDVDSVFFELVLIKIIFIAYPFWRVLPFSSSQTIVQT